MEPQWVPPRYRNPPRSGYPPIGLPQRIPVPKNPPSNSIAVPVLALVALFIFIMFLALFLYTWALSFVESDKQYPTINAISSQTDNGDFVIEITEVEPDAVCALHVDYRIEDDHGDPVPGVQGRVRSIYEVDLTFQIPEDWTGTLDREGNVSFVDKDVDGKICHGDVFVVKSVENGGVAKKGYQFILIFTVSHDVIGKVSFDDQWEWDEPSGHTELTTVTYDSENISVDNTSSVLDRFRYYIFETGFYTYYFNYLGNESRSITISHFHDDQLIVNNTMRVSADDIIYLTGNFTFEDEYSWEEFQERKIGIRISDTWTNETLYHGYVEYEIIRSGCGNPSFLLTSPLLAITVITLLITFSFSGWKTYNNPRKHK